MEHWDSNDGFGWLLPGFDILAIITLIQFLYGIMFTIRSIRYQFPSGGIIVYWLASLVSVVAFLQYGHWLFALLTYMVSSPLLATWLWYCSKTKMETQQ